MPHLGCYHEVMQKLKFISISFVVMLLTTGCQTIKQKTDEIVEKENKKLSKYISKPASVLQMDLGKPDEDFKNARGNFEFIYNTKKYGIPCERRFEINSNNIVVGFVSNGCF
ncbi:hypothetical protein N9I22_01135 [Candidatus Pelagibacter sp.]|nr:hypothetical protein [Candidatus Pelagibacter sp.]